MGHSYLFALVPESKSKDKADRQPELGCVWGLVFWHEVCEHGSTLRASVAGKRHLHTGYPVCKQTPPTRRKHSTENHSAQVFVVRKTLDLAHAWPHEYPQIRPLKGSCMPDEAERPEPAGRLLRFVSTITGTVFPPLGAHGDA